MIDYRNIHILMTKSPPKELLDEVRYLLYKVYVENQKWDFSCDNPSGVKVITLPDGRKLLTDNRDEIAIWCIVLYQGKVIAGSRACHRNSEGLFEVQAYNTGQNFDALLGVDICPNMVELTRGVVNPYFERYGIFPMMLKAIFEYCNKNRLSAFTAPANEAVITIYKTVEFPDSGVKFKFEPQDPTMAHLFIARYDLGEISKVLINFEKLIEKKKTNSLQRYSSFKFIKNSGNLTISESPPSSSPSPIRARL